MEFDFLKWSKGEAAFVAGVVALIFGVSFWQVRIGEMKTRDAQRKSDAILIGRAVSSYFEDHGVYPAAEEGKIVACGRDGAEVCEWGDGPIVDSDGVAYLKKIPKDPLGYDYLYEVKDGEGGFRVYVALEYKRDRTAVNNLTTECGKNVQCRWYVED